MSHLVTLETRIHDPAAIAAACQRLGLPAPVQGTAKLYSGEASGLLLQLPGWQFPAVIDPRTGTVRYDNYEGADVLKQLYRASQKTSSAILQERLVLPHAGRVAGSENDSGK